MIKSLFESDAEMATEMHPLMRSLSGVLLKVSLSYVDKPVTSFWCVMRLTSAYLADAWLDASDS